LLSQQEQARIVREQANQAKLDTRKKTFDQMKYERENTPTYAEEQERIEANTIRRLLNKAYEGEILSASAQNTLLPYLQRLALSGVQGPPVYLDQDQLKQINTTVGTSGGNIALLKNGGKVTWPFVLRGATSKKLDALLPQVVKAAADETLEPDQYFEVTKLVNKLQDELVQRWKKDQIDSSSYFQAKSYVESLRSAVNILETPSAVAFLKGSYAATGETMQELVQNMGKKGLKFAPSTPGTESAYYGLYNAMVAFAAGEQNDSGFRLRMAPGQPSKAPPVKE
jgi:hypothetical protein